MAQVNFSSLPSTNNKLHLIDNALEWFSHDAPHRTSRERNSSPLGHERVLQDMLTESLGVKNGIPRPRRRGFRTLVRLFLSSFFGCRFHRGVVPTRETVRGCPRHRRGRMKRSADGRRGRKKNECNFLTHCRIRQTKVIR